MVIKKRCLLWDWTNSSGPGNPGVPWAMNQCDFHGPISSVSNWNTWTPPELHNRAPYRPMVHLEAQLSGGDWQNILNSHEPIVHFFNEPDKNNIPPQRAAQAWHSQMVPLRRHGGKKLVGPSVSNDENGQRWLEDFMRLTASDPPDYVGLHYYGADGDACIRYLEGMHARYRRPIIVSEIASVARDTASVYGFTIRLANFMDETEWIFEYGFFGCMRKLADGFVSPAARLMEPDGRFTDLMMKLQWDQPVKPGLGGIIALYTGAAATLGQPLLFGANTGNPGAFTSEFSLFQSGSSGSCGGTTVNGVVCAIEESVGGNFISEFSAILNIGASTPSTLENSSGQFGCPVPSETPAVEADAPTYPGYPKPQPCKLNRQQNGLAQCAPETNTYGRFNTEMVLFCLNSPTVEAPAGNPYPVAFE